MRFLNKVLNSEGIAQILELSAVFGSKTAMPLGEFLKLALETLKSVPHVLIGGLALGEYAKPRMTHDLDFVIISTEMDAIIKLLESKGFTLKESLPYNGPKRDIVKFEYQGREVDFLFFKSAEFASHVLKRARSASVLGKPVKVASVEDLVVTKLASLRWKDKADIMAIRQKSDTLDLGYIRERLWDLGISDRIEFLKLPADE